MLCVSCGAKPRLISNAFTEGEFGFASQRVAQATIGKGCGSPCCKIEFGATNVNSYLYREWVTSVYISIECSAMRTDMDLVCAHGVQ